MIIKLASITIPDSHLKEDHKELEKMKGESKGILHEVKSMEKEDSEAKHKTYKCKSCDARVSKPNTECSKCAGK
jgi:hypothetical protein